MHLTSIKRLMLKKCSNQSVTDAAALFFWHPGKPANLLLHKFTPAAEQEENMDEQTHQEQKHQGFLLIPVRFSRALTARLCNFPNEKKHVLPPANLKLWAIFSFSDIQNQLVDNFCSTGLEK